MPAKKPIILCVDDDPQVLSAIDRDLRQEFRPDYRILKARSGDEALEVLKELKGREEPLALVLADQRMPGMEGVELLTHTRELFPQAKRVLLTAYADTEAAIRAINSARLDHYLMKPWDPPEQLLYPTLHDLLNAWQAEYRPKYAGLRLIGFQWSPLSHELKDFLAGYMVGFQWLDFESNEEGRTLLRTTSFTADDLPVVVFPDGTAVSKPERATIAAHLGLNVQARHEGIYDVTVIGAGPSGLAAAVYGASEGLKTLIIERQTPGGQAGSSSRIENYLGFPTGLSGAELAHRAWAQAVRLGAEFLSQEVRELCVQDGYKVLRLTDGAEIKTKAVIMATGVSYRVLGVPGEDKLSGAGVYYGAARTEARSCDRQDVYIVGGGNSAGQAAMYLSTYARRVFIVIRGESLAASMSAYLIQQIGETANIEILSHSQVKEVRGDDHLSEVVISNHGQEEVRPARALFVFIGAKPSTEWMLDQVLCDGKGYLLTGPALLQDPRFKQTWKREREPYLLETCIPGVFAAGDSRAGAMARVASAVGEGSMAIKFVHQYLDE
jgi:thioredoxin reductase (NADPH)